MLHRLVIIDPLIETCEELCEMLRKAGHSIVDISQDYTQGVGKTALYKPTAVIIHMMPDRLPALYCARSIQSVNSKIPILIVSSIRPDRDIVEMCKEIEVKDFIVRPFSAERIHASLCDIKAPDEAHKRGTVVCVGFTPPTSVRMMIAQYQLEYLFYPTCHLAIQCFRQNHKNRVVTLIVQKDLEMYSQMLRRKEVEESDLLGLPPWKQVILDAQIAYQEYWKQAIEKGLLPQMLPCLYIPRKSANPWLLPEKTIDELPIQLIENPANFKQLVPSKIKELQGKLEMYPALANQVNAQLDHVEREMPSLLLTKSDDAAKPEEKPLKKIDRSKGVVPKSSRKKTSRMIFEDE